MSFKKLAKMLMDGDIKLVEAMHKCVAIGDEWFNKVEELSEALEKIVKEDEYHEE